MSDRAGEKAVGRHGEGSKEEMLWPEGAINDGELGDAMVCGQLLAWAGGCPSGGALLAEHRGIKRHLSMMVPPSHAFPFHLCLYNNPCPREGIA